MIKIGLHKKTLEELYARYDNKKKLLLDELKRNFGRMRDMFTRDEQRLELVSVIFESRNDDDAQQTHVNFEDSIAILNNEVRVMFGRFTGGVKNATNVGSVRRIKFLNFNYKTIENKKRTILFKFRFV